jgi:hypothetical protein
MVAESARFALAEERLPTRGVDFAGAACSCFLREESKDTGHLQYSEGIHSKEQVRTPFRTIFAPHMKQVRMDCGGRHSLKHFSASIPHTSTLFACREAALELASCVLGAGDGARTRDSLLGRQELYH